MVQLRIHMRITRRTIILRRLVLVLVLVVRMVVGFQQRVQQGHHREVLHPRINTEYVLVCVHIRVVVMGVVVGVDVGVGGGRGVYDMTDSLWID